MAATKNEKKKSQNLLDTFSEKARRGRPGVPSEEIAGRAINMRYQFESQWEKIGEALLTATTPQAVNSLLTGTYLERDLVPHMARTVLDVMNDPKFPKRTKAQINFLADSLAALGSVSPRRSRDICTAERARKKKQNRIIRQDFYIECTCGYEGPAKHSKCPGCETAVAREISWHFQFGG
jgi:hypothetical protein